VTEPAACDNCGTAYDAQAIACPFCRAPRGVAGLAMMPVAGLDGLTRSLTESLLARSDAGLEDLLARDLAGPLSPGDLRDAIERVDQRSDPSVADLEGSLTLDAAIALDGITLADLVDRGGDAARIVKRGLVLLKHERWPEALEWWSLQREALAPDDVRLELLLLLLEAFTRRLAGDRRADDVKARIFAHPLYRRLRGIDRP